MKIFEQQRTAMRGEVLAALGISESNMMRSSSMISMGTMDIQVLVVLQLQTPRSSTTSDYPWSICKTHARLHSQLGRIVSIHGHGGGRSLCLPYSRGGKMQGRKSCQHAHPRNRRFLGPCRACLGSCHAVMSNEVPGIRVCTPGETKWN